MENKNKIRSKRGVSKVAKSSNELYKVLGNVFNYKLIKFTNKNYSIMNNAKDRQKLSWEGMFYSIQRIDLLIVSICGAGIYVCLETIKYLSDKCQDISLLVRISGGIFLFGIIINFISQLYGYKANKEDFFMCQTEIDAGNKISDKEQKEIDEHDKKAGKYSKLTDRLNYASMFFMFSGLMSIMYYFLFIF